MERLISSSSSSSSLLPKPLLLPGAATFRRRPPPVPCPRLKVAAAAFQHGDRPPPPTPRLCSSSASPAVGFSEKKATSGNPSTQLGGGGDFVGPLLRKATMTGLAAIRFWTITTCLYYYLSATPTTSHMDLIPLGVITTKVDQSPQHFLQVASILVLVLLSASIASIVQPILAMPAYAMVPGTAKTGGMFLRTELLSSAWTGFVAGCLHTLSGPDHLAALAPLSIGRTRLESAVVGALWGCGHDAGQVIFGLLFLLLKDRLHIEVIRTWGTRVVGITLLVIGAMGIREASEVPAPCVALESGQCDVSLMDHLATAPSEKKKIGFATFATGIVHGLQPDALMMVLPALALPSRLAGAAFLGMFLVGTVLAMGSYTVFIGSCSEALKDRVPRITEKLTWAASLVAISMGLAILISQLFGFSLY